MPIYKCRNCKKTFNLSARPGICESCGNTQFKLADQRLNKLPVYTGKTQLTSLSAGKTEPITQSFKEEELPSSIQSSSSLNSITGETFASTKTSPKPLTQKSSFWSFLNNKWSFLLGIGLVSAIFYVFWEAQFNTDKLKNVVLQEKFQQPKAWYFTDGARLEKNRLHHLQTKPNHYGASLWKGDRLTNLDFSADVVKVQGLNNVPYGLIARVSGNNAENFYYLFIDGSGEFIMGKNMAEGWLHKVGWQADSSINKGNKKNRLRLVVKDNLIIGYINGDRVGSFRDDTYKAGTVGLFSMRGKGQPTRVYFDNVIVKSDEKKK